MLIYEGQMAQPESGVRVSVACSKEAFASCDKSNLGTGGTEKQHQRHTIPKVLR
jgi:hypothetical protein